MTNFKNLLLLTASIILFASCSENEELSNTGISEDEAAELVGSSLTSDIQSVSYDVGAFGYETKKIIDDQGRIDQIIPGCGETVEKEFGNTYKGEFVTFTYNGSYEATLDCLFGIPISLDAVVTSSTSFESQRLSTTGSLQGDMLVDLDEENVGNYLVNSTLSRTGSATQKLGGQVTFDNKYSIVVTNLSMSTSYIAELLAGNTPEGAFVEGGSAFYEITGSSTAGNGFEFTASVTFNGDGTATITINETEYNVDLNSGELI